MLARAWNELGFHADAEDVEFRGWTIPRHDVEDSHVICKGFASITMERPEPEAGVDGQIGEELVEHELDFDFDVRVGREGEDELVFNPLAVGLHWSGEPHVQ